MRLQLARPTFLAPHPTSPPHTPHKHTPYCAHKRPPRQGPKGSDGWVPRGGAVTDKRNPQRTPF